MFSYIILTNSYAYSYVIWINLLFDICSYIILANSYTYTYVICAILHIRGRMASRALSQYKDVLPVQEFLLER